MEWKEAIIATNITQNRENEYIEEMFSVRNATAKTNAFILSAPNLFYGFSFTEYFHNTIKFKHAPYSYEIMIERVNDNMKPNDTSEDNEFYTLSISNPLYPKIKEEDASPNNNYGFIPNINVFIYLLHKNQLNILFDMNKKGDIDEIYKYLTGYVVFNKDTPNPESKEQSTEIKSEESPLGNSRDIN